MKQYFFSALDWSEVWAMMIPLSVVIFRRQQQTLLRPVILYLWVGFLINIAIDAIAAINSYLPGHHLSNNPLYNVHSITRFACFGFYFTRLQRSSFTRLKQSLALLAFAFVIINFTFFERFLNQASFSGNLLTVEAYLLLIYCLLYYLAELKDDENPFNGPHFWIVTGLSIYLVTNFFVFLFYTPVVDVNPTLAVNIWNVHNVAFIIFCLFITKGLYASRY